jgi:hypothetical protein
MSNLVSKEESQVEVFNSSLPVTEGMLTQLKNQRALLKDFVKSQLVENTDFGVIPGTKGKKSLFKPGAEKIRGLFGLRLELDRTGETLDIQNNFGMYTYKAKVYRGDNLIAECEGSTNSQEQKYKERKVWRQKANGPGKEEIKEVTPVCDILNTLQKMAQKRAMVGAIILAVGASDFFTQDLDDPDDAKNVGVIPREVNSNQVPNVVNVTAKPVQNNQTGKFLIAAIVPYEERKLAQDAGFRWNKDSKEWVKEVSQDEFEMGFKFEVVRVV